jgi:hypothetical protein
MEIYTDVIPSAVQLFQKVNNCLKMAQVRPKHVAFDVILMLFLIKERL